RRFARIAQQPWWAPGEMQVLTAADVSERLGETSGAGGLWMGGALTVRPAAILAAWLADVPVVKGRVDRLERAGDRWRLMDDRANVLIEADTVVVAAGWGTARLLPELDLRPVRGQADWITGVQPPCAVAWGGYVAPTGEGFLYGATHDRGDQGTQTRADDTARNGETLKGRLPHLLDMTTAERPTPSLSRAAIRATTADRLPISLSLALGEDLHVLTGLGSRGFCIAPLLAERLASAVATTREGSYLRTRACLAAR
ncbi:MAG: FAD-dependent oxidoreductase, partial [Sphingobium sp.]